MISELKEMGVEVNPYNLCFVNKMVNRSQMTIQWHVDDLMISHTSGEAILQFLHALEGIYGDNLAENTEKIHDYLRMTFNFSFRNEVEINMMQYILKMIAAFRKEIVGKAATPAGDHFFE